MILEDKMKQRGETESEMDNGEMEAGVILHGHKWSRFVWVLDMIIF